MAVECADAVIGVPQNALLHKINEGKNQNPHKIDEMPIQAGDLDMLRDVTAAAHRGKHGGVIDHPAGHVHAM